MRLQGQRWNLWGPVQNENVGPLYKMMKSLRKATQSIFIYMLGARLHGFKMQMCAKYFWPLVPPPAMPWVKDSRPLAPSHASRSMQWLCACAPLPACTTVLSRERWTQAGCHSHCQLRLCTSASCLHWSHQQVTSLRVTLDFPQVKNS